MKSRGFTIVELLIVIVVIGILAAITIVAFNGIQDRSRKSKIESDISQLNRAIMAARVNESKTFYGITGNTHTGGSCISKASDTDLATLDKTTDSCWVIYRSTLNTLSTRSGVDVRNLIDPWGRPYYIDENEGETAGALCNRDKIAVYGRPHVAGSQGALTNSYMVTNSLTC